MAPTSALQQAKRVGRRLPETVKKPLVAIAYAPVVQRRMAPPRWGNLRRQRPFSRGHGSARGIPVDRGYLDDFFGAHAADITGRVLEVGDPRYANAFGTAQQVDILDIDPHNRMVTVVADLADAGSLPVGAFDCCVVPQTLQYVRDLDTAVANLWAALAPGGTLLVSVPSVARTVDYVREVDRWRIFPPGLHDLLTRNCPGGTVDVQAYGNLTVCMAFLLGLAAEDLDPADFNDHDPDFPLVTCASARKAAQ